MAHVLHVVDIMSTKLTLNHETIRTLQNTELDRAAGGGDGFNATGTASGMCPPGTFGHTPEIVPTATASAACPAGTFGRRPPAGR